MSDHYETRCPFCGGSDEQEITRLREVLEECACNCEAGTCAEREGFRDWPCGGPARAALKEAP